MKCVNFVCSKIKFYRHLHSFPLLIISHMPMADYVNVVDTKYIFHAIMNPLTRCCVQLHICNNLT